jgi:hypothetical protein
MRWAALALIQVAFGCRKSAPPPAFRFTAITIDDASAPIKVEPKLEKTGDGTVTDIQPRIDDQEALSTVREFVPEQLMLGLTLDAAPTDSADKLDYTGEMRWVRLSSTSDATIILAHGVFVALDHGKTVGESGPVVFVIQSRPGALKDYLASSDQHFRDIGIWLSLNATEEVLKSPEVEQLLTTLKAKGYMRSE